MLDDFIQEEMNVDEATIPIGSHGDFIKIKPATNKQFESNRARVMRRHKQAAKKDKLKSAVVQREMSPVIAKYLMIDWQMSATKNAAKKLFPKIKTVPAKDREGNVREGIVSFPFTEENVTAVLSHPQNKDFFLFCVDSAAETGNFVKEEREDDIKN